MNTNTNNTEMSLMIDNVVIAENIEKKKIEILFQNEDEAILQTTTMSSMNEMNNVEENIEMVIEPKKKRGRKPNPDKKIKTPKTKTKLRVEEDEPVVSATMEIPREFRIDDAVFEDEHEEVVAEPARKWTCVRCERGGDYCESCCRYCDGRMCRACCNTVYCDLDDEPIITECGTCREYECVCDTRWMPDEPVKVSADELCGVCVGLPEPTDELLCSCGQPLEDGRFDECEFCDQQRADNEYHDTKLAHEQWNEEHPYPDRDGEGGACNDCGARCELAEDSLCHYCFHHGDPANCWCVGGYTHEVQENECASCGYVGLDGVMVCPDCGALPDPNEEDDDEQADDDEPTDDDDETVSNDGCPVCYEPTEHTTECGHKLCVECHTNMTTNHNYNCPICRQRMVLGVRMPMTDAEKLADYDRMVAENRRLKAEVARLEPIARRSERRDARRAMRGNAVAEPVVRVPRQPRQPRVPRAPRVPANHPEINLDEEDVVGIELNPRGYSGALGVPSTVQVVLNEGEVLGDIEFGLRPRLKCCIQGCVRRTRRVCDGCRNIRVCEEHQRCPDCRE